MLYKQNWDAVKKRYLEYWALENHDRPLLAIKSPKARPSDSAPPLKEHASQKERWFDTRYLLERVNHQFENTFFGAEALPTYFPNLGPDIFAAFYGVDLEFGENTSWSKYHDLDFDVYSGLKLNRQNQYYQKMLEMTKATVEDGRDKYLVGVTDLHPGADALVSMRGPQQLCFDAVERPEDIQRAVMELFDGFKTTYDELYQLTTKYQQGSTNWMGVWHPERWYVSSCDFAALISNDMFKELIMEELLAELDFLDASIFHLDGPDALRHLDTLLSIDRLKGIQWVYGAGNPTAAHWIDILKRIQSAGKMIHIDVVPDDLDLLLEQLKPEGVLYTMHVSSQEQAEAQIKKVNQYKKKFY